MTDSEHAALSAQLARALGWECVVESRVNPFALVGAVDGSATCAFSYRDPTVYGPLIEWLGIECGLVLRHLSCWCWSLDSRGCEKHRYGGADTLPEAVARAVIAVKSRA